MLKPQDIVISLKLLQYGINREAPTYSELSHFLKMSQSEAHGAVQRALRVGLLSRPPGLQRSMPVVVRQALGDFLICGLKYVWPTKIGGLGRGMPTATSVSVVAEEMDVGEPETPYVWPSASGSQRGETVKPLYPKCTDICMSDPALHEWLALIDVLRLKTNREAKLAEHVIRKRLS